MAAEFLRSHGIDLPAELARIQRDATGAQPDPCTSELPSERGAQLIRNASLPLVPPGTRWDVHLVNGNISKITQHATSPPLIAPDTNVVEGKGALLVPSLCHPHVHIDKAYLLSHPKYSDLRIETGDFPEAMSLTGQAKARFEEHDLLERGQRVIDESVEAGVTHMRTFVEVDAGVGLKCLHAGIKLKQKAEAEGKCRVQICAFAQLPLFSDASAGEDEDHDGGVIRGLMEQAAATDEVDVVGSTPYVESSLERERKNVDWMIDLSANHVKHLDFHLDYHRDAETNPTIWHAISRTKEKDWKARTPNKTIVFGHCTRLTLFDHKEWQTLKAAMGQLPISFVGLPTSDMFMIRTPETARGTLNVLELIKEHGINACLGINNIGNAFTPHGSCDPLSLACNGIGIYQAGTEKDAQMLYECVSTRARKAIGFSDRDDLTLREGGPADLLLFDNESEHWRTRRSVTEAVYLYDQCKGRQAFLEGRQANHWVGK